MKNHIARKSIELEQENKKIKVELDRLNTVGLRRRYDALVESNEHLRRYVRTYPKKPYYRVNEVTIEHIELYAAKKGWVRQPHPKKSLYVYSSKKILLIFYPEKITDSLNDLLLLISTIENKPIMDIIEEMLEA